MSSLSVQSTNVSLDSVRPFQKNTKWVLKQYIFSNNEWEESSCRAIQKFAKAAIKFQELEQNLKDGCSVWLFARRSWAVLKTVGALFLFTTATFAAAALAVLFFPASFTDKNETTFLALGMLVMGSLGLLNRSLNHTCELFETPSPQLLEKRRKELVASKPTQQHIENLDDVKEVLESYKAEAGFWEQRVLGAAISDIDQVQSGLTAIQ